MKKPTLFQQHLYLHAMHINAFYDSEFIIFEEGECECCGKITIDRFAFVSFKSLGQIIRLCEKCQFKYYLIQKPWELN